MGKKYERLAGIKGAKKEGFTHTNPARVNMSNEEEVSPDIAKELYPVSEKDIEKLKESLPDMQEPKETKEMKKPKRPVKEIEVLDV